MVLKRHLSLTYVEYAEGDFLGYILAYISLFPIFSLFGLGCIFLSERNIYVLSVVVGLIASEIVAIGLKRHIMDPRPPSCDRHIIDSGMPSSHATWMFFLLSFFALFNNRWKRISFSNEVFIQILILGILSIAVAYSRVYLQYHYVSQVLVGAVLGSLNGCMWYLFTTRFLAVVVYTRIVNWKVSKLLRINSGNDSKEY